MDYKKYMKNIVYYSVNFTVMHKRRWYVLRKKSVGQSFGYAKDTATHIKVMNKLTCVSAMPLDYHKGQYID